MEKHWSYNSFFYHIYPLGFCGAPFRNNSNSHVVRRLDKVNDHVEHMKNLGVNALYIGPLFESQTHGYDTIDYFNLDRRLGDNKTLEYMVYNLQRNGIKVVFDAVFNHVGRNFFAFQDVKENLQYSRYKDWFHKLSFDKKSPFNDPFKYDGWKGHYDLVKLNLKNPEVKEYIFEIVRFWIKEFNIDGLRLDAADCMDKKFLKNLTAFCRKLKPDFWIVGEVVHGDYSKWATKDSIDSVTNYECYKALYSCHNDKNYFEIAHCLDREFGEKGIYKDINLYNFVDNHDVNRIGSILKEFIHIYPLHILLFSIPGIPSIYYGSEFGVKGKKKRYTDEPLRPAIDDIYKSNKIEKDLYRTIRKLSDIRLTNNSLMYGNYKQIHVAPQQFVFSRTYENKTVIICLNSSEEKSKIKLDVSKYKGVKLIDLLNNNEEFEIKKETEIELYSNWGRILQIA